MSKHILGAIFVIAAALMAASWTAGEFVRAAPARKKDPGAAVQKAAEKDAKRITRDAQKRIKSAAKAAQKDLKRLAKVLKTGKGADAFGPADPGAKPVVSQAQAFQIFLAMIIRMNTFQEDCYATIVDTNAALGSSAPINEYVNQSLPRAYSTGFVQRVSSEYYGSYQSSYVSLQRTMYEACGSASQWGATWTYSPCGIPKPRPWTYRGGQYTNETYYDTYWYSDDNSTSYYSYNSYYRARDYTQYYSVCTSESGEEIGRFDCSRVGEGTTSLCSGTVSSDVPAGTCSQALEYSCDDGVPATCRSGTWYSYCLPSPSLDRSLVASNQTVVEIRRDLGTVNFALPFFVQLVVDVLRESSKRVGVPGNVPVDHCDQSHCSWETVQRSANKTGPTPVLGNASFPPGAGPFGFTVLPNLSGVDPGGDVHVVSMVLQADVPLSDPTNLYQYGFVFDQDGNAGNNFVPLPEFSGDFFQNTDKWYEVLYTPQGGWTLKVTDARNGGFVEVTSAARAVINGNSITLAVPASEFAVAKPAFRISAFRHTGDFGLSSPFDFSADYYPLPEESLQAFDR